MQEVTNAIATAYKRTAANYKASLCEAYSQRILLDYCRDLSRLEVDGGLSKSYRCGWAVSLADAEAYIHTLSSACRGRTPQMEFLLKPPSFYKTCSINKIGDPIFEYRLR